MKTFLGDDFLLTGSTASRLYNEYAKAMPIIDYHCHLNPREIFENKKFRNITELWLSGDHYKWRAMRACGIDESLITGDADDYDKFAAYAAAMPGMIGNPLYQWSHLELRRFFDVNEILNAENAPAIWEKVNARLGGNGLGARDFIRISNVRVVCTTDDPADSLEYHIKLKEDRGFETVVLPSFRPDKGLEINRPTFLPWLRKLEEASGGPIADIDQFLAALEARARFFHQVGCRVSDHALDTVPYAEASRDEAAAIFARALKGEKVGPEDEMKFKTFLLLHLGKLYAELGWAMQYHINAARNLNPRMFERLGPDTGFDAIGDSSVATPLARLLGALEAEDKLTKTILYSLNPAQNAVLAAMIGSFQGGGIPGKIQFGSAWWFNDTKEGMIQQMKTLADMGLLPRFIGMLTDSRSFLSYTRHEYFRRILCNLLGEWADNGEVPADMELLGGIVQDICYRNAERYFGFGQ